MDAVIAYDTSSVMPAENMENLYGQKDAIYFV